MSQQQTPTPLSLPHGDAAQGRLVQVLFIGVFMAALDTAIVGPVLPALREAFGVDNRSAGLLTTVFSLSSLCSTALMAYFSDRHGRRPVYLTSVALFAIGSVCIAAAPDYDLLLVGRAIQGIGAGGIAPVASAVIGDVFSAERRGRILGLIGATHGMAFVLGPPLATLLTSTLGWRWLFLVNLPVALLVLWWGARSLPSQRASAAPGQIDLAGITCTLLFLLCLVLGISRMADSATGVLLWPWFLAVSGALLLALVLIEKRQAQALIPINLFANRQLACAFVLTLGVGFSMGGIVFLTSIATLAYGISVESAGLALLPLVLCSMVGSMAAGRLLNRLGARSMVIFGFGSLTLGYLQSAVPQTGLTAFLIASVLIGMGVGVVVSGALRTIAMDEAPLAQRGSAQGLMTIFNAVGTLLAVTCISAMADFEGGELAGFGHAYLALALSMLVMLVVAFGLKRKSSEPA
ncbi:MFS transporter [Limnohabitans sp.]|jgi:MFS family permease|uniref:MFS transporter n=1 Tax=Limnohabitans sp. TaxID=1907725 RepID=UPI0037C175CD